MLHWQEHWLFGTPSLRKLAMQHLDTLSAHSQNIVTESSWKLIGLIDFALLLLLSHTIYISPSEC